MMKRVFQLLIVLCIAAYAVPAFADSAESGEAPASWANESVEYMSSYQLLPEELLSSYSANIRRDEFAAALISIYNEACQNFHTFDNQPEPFSDTLGNPYAAHIKKAYIMGFIYGTSKTEYSPQKYITREEIAAITYRFLRLMYPEETVNTAKGFEDGKNISSYALEAVEFCAGLKIMNGTGNNNFSPKNYLTRQEAMVLLHNICQRYQVIEKGRGAAIKELPQKNSSMHEKIADGYLYINIQDYPFEINGEVKDSATYNLIRTPLEPKEQNQGEILLEWDVIEAYAIGDDKIYFCDTSDIYAIDKKGGNLKKIRNFSELVGLNSNVGEMIIAGDWIFLGASMSDCIFKLRRDGTCISILSKGAGYDILGCGEYIFTTGFEWESFYDKFQVNRRSLTGESFETLYSHQQKEDMFSYSAAVDDKHFYLIIYDYGNVEDKNVLVEIDGSTKSSKILKEVNNREVLRAIDGSVYLQRYTDEEIYLENLSGGRDYQVKLPEKVKGDMALMHKNHMIFFSVDFIDGTFTRSYHVYDLETGKYTDIYGNPR